MKNIMNPRTVRSTLDRATKRLAEIEMAMAELQAERDAVNQLRAVLDRLLPVSLPGLEGPQPELGMKTGPVEQLPANPDTSGQLVDSGDCFWATGVHQHRILANGGHLCLAPKEQERRSHDHELLACV